MAVEHLRRLAPVAGTLSILACDAVETRRWQEGDTEPEERVHRGLREVFKAAPWITNDAAECDLGGVSVLLFALCGWNMMAGVYRRQQDLLVVDPDGPFWREGGGEPNEEQGVVYLESFLDALDRPLPTERRLCGSIRINSGELLLADAWQAMDEEACLTLRVSAGDYVIERFRIDCPWDDAVNELMGIQVAVIRRAR